MSNEILTFRALPPSGETPVLVFDLGNVLVRLHSLDRLWRDQRALPGERSFDERWGRSQAVLDYETGRLKTLDEFYEAAQPELGFEVPRAEFTEIFRRMIGELFAETIPLLTALKEYYPLFLLSNVGEEHWQYCRDQLGLDGFFTGTVLSYEVGVMKPDPQIFRLLLERCGCDPQRILYFDDRVENVAAARRMGIQALTSLGGPPLIADLQRLKLIGE